MGRQAAPGEPEQRDAHVLPVIDAARAAGASFAIGVLSVLSGTPSTVLVTAWGPSPGTEQEYTP